MKGGFKRITLSKIIKNILKIKKNRQIKWQIQMA